MMAAALTLQRLGDTDRDLYLFDTFTGMAEPGRARTRPRPTTATRPTSAGGGTATGRASTTAAAAGPRSASRACARRCSRTGYPAERVHLVKGMVEDTHPGPGARPDRAAAPRHRLVRLDQARARAALPPPGRGRRADRRRLRPLRGRPPGGRRVPRRRAAQRLLLNRIDYTGRIGVKQSMPQPGLVSVVAPGAQRGRDVARDLSTSASRRPGGGRLRAGAGRRRLDRRHAGAARPACREADPRVRVVILSRNFGYQAAMSAGLDHAQGDAVVTIDADLQDPPELIPELIERWRDGADVVYAVRETPRRRGLAEAEDRALVHAACSSGSAGSRSRPNAGDFRLLDRRAVDALRAMPERNRFLRGMAVWVGYRQTSVPYKRDARYAGDTRYRWRTLIRIVARRDLVVLPRAAAAGHAAGLRRLVRRLPRHPVRDHQPAARASTSRA